MYIFIPKPIKTEQGFYKVTAEIKRCIFALLDSMLFLLLYVVI